MAFGVDECENKIIVWALVIGMIVAGIVGLLGVLGIL